MIFQITNRNILIIAVGISLLLSLWTIYIDPVINNDGFLYILIADTVQDGNFSNAFSIYRWPFYSFMIAGLSYVTGLSNETTAYLLNVILILIIVVSYVSIVKLLGGDQRVIIIAAIVILLFPSINRYRSFISRDFGYLAFYMLGLYIFFKHLIKPEWYWPVIWSVLLVVAALFRIEAIAILISLPFVSWFVFEESKSRRVKIGVTYGLVLVSLFLLLAWWFSGSHLNKSGFSGVSGIYDLVKNFMEVFTTSYAARYDQMQTLLTHYAKDYATVALVAAFFIILFSEVIRSITIPYIILIIYGLRKLEVFSENRVKNAWVFLVLIQCSILFGIMLKSFFITGRFPLALSLTVLLIVPFIFSKVYLQWQEGERKKTFEKWFFPVIVVLAIIVSLQGLNAFTAKKHYKEGGLWIKQKIKPEEKLLTNEGSVFYYAGRNPAKQFDAKEWSSMYTNNFSLDEVVRVLREKKGKNYKYIAIGIKRKNKNRKQEIIDMAGSTPIKSIKNDYGGELLIFTN